MEEDFIQADKQTCRADLGRWTSIFCVGLLPKTPGQALFLQQDTHWDYVKVISPGSHSTVQADEISSPSQKHNTLFLNFLRNAISDTSGIFPLTINPPSLCFLISKHSSLFRKSCFKLRKRNILWKNNKVLWLLSERCKRRSGNCLFFLKSCWCADADRNCHLLNYQQVRLTAQPDVLELC